MGGRGLLPTLPRPPYDALSNAPALPTPDTNQSVRTVRKTGMINGTASAISIGDGIIDDCSVRNNGFTRRSLSIENLVLIS